MVKHLPQHFIDLLCNERSEELVRELEQAIYSDVPVHELLGSTSLRDLVDKRVHAIEVNMEQLGGDLSTVNATIVGLEQQSYPDHIDDVGNRIADLKEDARG